MTRSGSARLLVNIVDPLRRLLMRWRWRFSLPEDVLSVLGVDEVGSSLSFDEFMEILSSPECKPLYLSRYMSRVDAEAVFSGASRKERFNNKTLFSFYFAESWVEFILHFDGDSRLRRLYLQYNGLSSDEGLEIALPRAKRKVFFHH